MIGDFYINTENNRIYGPKTSSGWGSSTSLVGPAGVTGASPFTLKSDGDAYYTDGFVGLGTTVPQARLHIKNSTAGGDAPENHVAYIENTRDGPNTNGLAIRLNNSVKTSGTAYGLNDTNNFITFYRNTALPNLVLDGHTSEIAGRIEAVSVLNFDAMLSELRSLIAANAALPLDLLSTYTLNTGISLGFGGPLGAVPYLNFATPTFSIDPTKITGVVTTLRNNFDNAIWAYGIWTDPIAAAIAESVITLDRGGVTYESGSGDYAEWLERSDPNETIKFGDIVGVRGGRISRRTAGADQLLVVSHKPIVLGNMPAPGREKLSEKVAFMGQVPVKIVGRVARGDYIIASGAGDGFGRAITPSALTAELAELVVGVAWGESQLEILKFVNVAVGLNPTHALRVATAQQTKIRELENKLGAVETKLADLQKLESRLNALVAKIDRHGNAHAALVAQREE